MDSRESCGWLVFTPDHHQSGQRDPFHDRRTLFENRPLRLGHWKESGFRHSQAVVTIDLAVIAGSERNRRFRGLNRGRALAC